MAISRSGFLKSWERAPACAAMAGLAVRAFLVGRLEMRLVEVGMDSGIGSDILGFPWDRVREMLMGMCCEVVCYSYGARV